ncbi:MAG: DinB family protein, partial [Promethearchaeota archaeon]
MPTTKKNALTSLVSVLRTYSHRLLADLTEEELRWVPAQTQARSILSYFRHVVNAEIYWLKELGFSPPDYLGNNSPFDEVLQGYDALESYLIQSIHDLPQDQLELITPEKTG